MYFNSYVFILAFLPVVLVGYYLINRTKKYRLGELWLLAASLFFIGYLNIYYIVYVCLLMMAGYGFLIWVTRKEASSRWRKTGLVAGLVFHVFTLLFFKYCNFFIDNINQVCGKRISFLEILLPIGISFYTFQQIAYLVDCYKAPSVRCNPLEYALFISFFPQFLQGPILLHDEMIPQLREEKNKHFNAERFGKGLYAFSLGLAKKVLLADNIAGIVNAGYSNIGELNTLSAILTMTAYSLQLYFDFSGYCDMAAGLGEMFQITIPANFNSPYKAVKVTDIWSRWHITLTRFFTRYVYIPLGGNRKGNMRMYANTFIIFCISGLWHGAAWTFVVWGILHGVAMIFSKWLERHKVALPGIVGWCGTFSFWVLSFSIFRAESLEEAVHLFERLFYGGIGKINAFFPETVKDHIELRILQRIDGFGILEQFPNFQVLALVLIPLVCCLVMKNTQEKVETFRFTRSKLIVTVTLLFYSIISMGGITVFLYSNF